MIRTCIIGAGGYAGAELVGLLLDHDEIDIVGLFASESRTASAPGAKPQRFDEVFPRYRGQTDLPLLPTSLDSVISLQPDAVFLATPHEVSHDLVPHLLVRGIVVFDLSAAFRLSDPAAYPKHYGFTHNYPELLKSAVYGLAERSAARIAGADLIAVPGCYPTSVLLPLTPLLDTGMIDASRPIIADCTSGVSGAGRSAALKSLYCEVSYQPYGVLSHRHAPEIREHALPNANGGRGGGANVIFTPHLAPYDRGIVSTIHATLAASVTERDIRAKLHEAYHEQPFLRLLSNGAWPSVNAVRYTNFCDIGLAVDDSRSHLIIVSAIDNLLKGAAGQAVQCMNIRFGLPQITGFSGLGLLAKGQELAHA